MYSQEYTSTLTQHIGYAISDYHIHNSVCMFELPFDVPCFHGCHSYAWMESNCCASAWVLSKREELEKEKWTWRKAPPHCQSLLKFITSAAEWEKAMKGSFLLCARNALILPGIRLINSPLIMSKLSQFYLISTCRLKCRRAQIVFACAFNTALIARVAEKFL